jgi:hypothetical protein
MVALAAMLVMDSSMDSNMCYIEKRSRCNTTDHGIDSDIGSIFMGTGMVPLVAAISNTFENHHA